MSQSLPASKLPQRPNLDQLKKQAKDLRAIGRYASLAEAQRAVALSYGFPSWTKLKLAVDLAALRRLIEDGDAEKVRAFVTTAPRIVSMPFADGSLPLHLAAGENRPAVIDVLVSAGASLETKYGKWAHSALSWAVTCSSFDAAFKLVELGVKPDLFCASGLGLLDAVKAFWSNSRLRARPSRTGSSRYSESGELLPAPPKADLDQVSDALYIACRCERVEVARWLLDHGADPSWRGYAGATCLAWAEFSGNAELCALLRERGGSDALLDRQYQSTPKAFAIMVLAGWGFKQMLYKRLMADRSLVSITGGIGTPLHAAADGGQEISVKLLLTFGADRSAKDPRGRTPAEVATAKGHGELAKLLLSGK